MPIRHWTDKLSIGETNELIKGIASIFTNRIADKAIRECFLDYISRDNILALCDYDLSYSHLSLADAVNVRQVIALFSKRSDLELGIDKREVAVGKFIEAERLCASTNDIFRARASGRFFFLPGVESVLHSAQRKIALILGDVPSLEEIRLRFGPGATTQVKKKNASVKRKLSMPFSCSDDAAPHIADVLYELPKWVFSEDELQSDADAVKPTTVELHHGRLDFVRKSFKTDRAIVVEPMLNQMVQLGIGDYIARRLKVSGVDLRDQSRNKFLACHGSIFGDLATLDLSSASDTVSKCLVLDLLPDDWFCFLSRFRTSLVDCDGYLIRQEKFSSMGNGFTFALESLIFYALAWASTDEALRADVSVYGDDIIVPVCAYHKLEHVLRCVGFVPNKDKSFASGPFRESCGGDYYYGTDIRPCYIKDRFSGQSLFVVHNFFAVKDDQEVCDLILPYIPKHVRKYGPKGYGDGHLISDYPLRPHGRERGWSGYAFETYTMKPRKDFSVLSGDRVYPFYSVYASEPRPEFIDQSWSPYSDVERAHITISDQCHSYDGRGRLGVSLPGAKAYKLIKVYTLSG